MTDRLFRFVPAKYALSELSPAVRPGQVGRGEVAGVVAGPRPFDLDDLRPEIAQDLGAVRSREDAGEVEDDDAVEGAVHADGFLREPWSGAPGVRRAARDGATSVRPGVRETPAPRWRRPGGVRGSSAKA